mmetsp:Transcript_97012/g.274099  ORF Transcript_97012/g.274099 Transcript_97012/m.274099 type:complete len:101 (+) Transcript_97012:110-412(+)|eukprot:CAMPEP_0117549550 /NCGR_PEP_ID=MMETSP0784-20121206/48223_1 /TAXON_ID=39447 /ORGANISM="" /LENGTH=100 /DNA_ID=CAMNT_0005346541 /DNA_START=108 /DNA_END=410 /DNA_ORIENTATION=-
MRSFVATVALVFGFAASASPIDSGAFLPAAASAAQPPVGGDGLTEPAKLPSVEQAAAPKEIELSTNAYEKTSTEAEVLAAVFFSAALMICWLECCYQPKK